MIQKREDLRILYNVFGIGKDCTVFFSFEKKVVFVIIYMISDNCNRKKCFWEERESNLYCGMSDLLRFRSV